MLTDTDVIVRLLISALLTGIVGLERELQGRAAGLRTHILVGIGSTLIMLTSIHIFEIYQGLTSVDPGRIAAQAISGIGFLGAGTIIRFRATVRGLTTAASLWAVCGIGLAIGSGFYIGAFVATALVFISLLLLTTIERSIIKTKQSERGE